jgi:hypothetical protein
MRHIFPIDITTGVDVDSTFDILCRCSCGRVLTMAFERREGETQISFVERALLKAYKSKCPEDREDP